MVVFQREMQSIQCEPGSCGAHGGGQTLEHDDKNVFAYDLIREAYEDTEESVDEEHDLVRCSALQSMRCCYGLPCGYLAGGPQSADECVGGSGSGKFSSFSSWSPLQGAFKFLVESCCQAGPIMRREPEHEGVTQRVAGHTAVFRPNPCSVSSPLSPLQSAIRIRGEAIRFQEGVSRQSEAENGAVPHCSEGQTAIASQSDRCHPKQGVFRGRETKAADCPQSAARVGDNCCPNPCPSSTPWSPIQSAVRIAGETCCPQIGIFKSSDGVHEGAPQIFARTVDRSFPYPCSSPTQWRPIQGEFRSTGETRCPQTGVVKSGETELADTPQICEGHADRTCPNPCLLSTPRSPRQGAFKSQGEVTCLMGALQCSEVDHEDRSLRDMQIATPLTRVLVPTFGTPCMRLSGALERRDALR